MSETAPKNLPRLLRLVALAVVTTGLTVGLSGPAHAILFLAEPFDYPDGDLNGNNGGLGFGGSQWTTAWSGSAYFDVGSGVVHSITEGATEDIERHFSLNEPSGTTIYMSALMTQPQAESNYNVSLGINDINTAFLAMTNKVFRTKLNGTAVTGGTVEVDRPYRIVTRLEFDVDGAGNERMTLWVDPASESDSHLLQVSKNTGEGSPGGRMNIYSDGANTTFLVDDVRFATAFEDVISGPITLYRDVVMADNPHAYYRLNLYNPVTEGPAVPDWATADGAQDAVIVGINNTQDGQPGIPGAYDTSVLLNQTGSNRDDYVVHKVGMSDPLTMVDDTVDDYTIEAWFKTAAVDGNLGGIAGFTSNVDGSEPYAALWRNGDDVWFYVRDDNSSVIANLNSNATEDGLVTADTWHHVVGVKDATTYSLYLDGELVDSTTLSSISGSFNRNRFQIGNMNETANHTYFPLEEAYLDEVAVYLHALGPADVRRHYLYGANLVPEPSTLVLSGLGMLCLIGCCRRRRKRAA